MPQPSRVLEKTMYIAIYADVKGSCGGANLDPVNVVALNLYDISNVIPFDGVKSLVEVHFDCEFRSSRSGVVRMK